MPEAGSLASSFRTTSRAAGAALATLGAGGLLFWSLRFPARGSLSLLWGATRPTTALCFLLGASALWLLQPGARGARRVAALASATLLVVLGVLAGAEDVLWDVNLEESLSLG